MKLSKKFFMISLLVIVMCFTMVISFKTVGEAKEVTLKAGTIIYVETTNTLDPSNLNVGDDVQFVIYDDVLVDDSIVIERGTPVSGTVTKAQGEGALGKAAKLTVKVNSVRAVDGTIIGLSGSKSVAGEDKQTEAVGGGLFLCAPMLLMKGEEATIPANSQIETRVMSSYNIDVN